MPRIQWHGLPAAVRRHLRLRAASREIDSGDLKLLLAWIDSDPNLPDFQWCKDFGSFKLVGEGAIPKTFLTREQPCYGQRV